MPKSSGKARNLLQRVRELASPTFQFIGNVIVFEEGPDVFITRTTRDDLPSDDELDLNELEGVRIDPSMVFAEFDPDSHTAIPSDLVGQCYEKLPDLADYVAGEDDENVIIGTLFLQELQACETIKKSSLYPHPNIAKYFGCKVRDDRVIALCFEKYSEHLEKRVKRKYSNFDKQKWLDSIRNGIEYLHELGYCHNDIHPANIMFREDDTPVLIDFDSCLREGETLKYKGGTSGYCRYLDWKEWRSDKENDFYSLQKVKEFLDKECRDA